MFCLHWDNKNKWTAGKGAELKTHRRRCFYSCHSLFTLVPQFKHWEWLALQSPESFLAPNPTVCKCRAQSRIHIHTVYFKCHLLRVLRLRAHSLGTLAVEVHQSIQIITAVAIWYQDGLACKQTAVCSSSELFLRAKCIWHIFSFPFICQWTLYFFLFGWLPKNYYLH